jgi:hypothetical protein
MAGSLMHPNPLAALAFGILWSLAGTFLIFGARKFQAIALSFYEHNPHAHWPIGPSGLNSPGFIWVARSVGILALCVGLYLLTLSR